jgi:hypothetical protein
MSDSITFELVLEAEADVVRGCCGKAHEFGDCPDSTTSESEED